MTLEDSAGEEEEIEEEAPEPSQGHVLDVYYEDITGREKDYLSAVSFM